MCKTLILCLILLICPFAQSHGSNLEITESELYKRAVKLFDRKKYRQAIVVFQKVEDLYPFSYRAMKAKLLSGISHYNMGNYSSAISDTDDYIQIYSHGEDLSYAYYLRVLSYYMQIHKVQLGQQVAYRTLDLATEYINLFPESKYTKEIEGKMKIVTEHILAKEYYTGMFYLRRGEYLAAIKRFRNVMSNRNTKYFLESVGYLIIAHSAFGLDLEVQQYKNLLVRNLEN
ncbi:outer membrane protein assembly factor BamD [Wolbachia endosymbiont of Cruorifilaria tuberocauda]|uniref:outer membrane protein assembly factor BamD n=1 Tax=Wolbachia endosymbiont of Cruorifilaria tuberocauda TaxID=1812111 RepID=UPI00158BF01E|nr:outer membrane protein assembly factor BamD [Wolbachia endosymbiont of Cruorifilaria tuberocauda]QKX01652.1 outer membrane protein assembly factor BamD [Wolbachia endosymbiont of Cruorifilaria tuberocauda]